MNVQALPMSRVKIRKIVKCLRKMLDLENELYFPIVRCVEYYFSYASINTNLEIVPLEEMADTYGTTNTMNGVMRIREDVYDGACNNNPRDRFTLCHEFGHYILHQPENICFARGKVPAYMEPEWQANTFAGELLAPYHLIGDMSIDDIARECVMSRQAAEIQYNLYHKL